MLNANPSLTITVPAYNEQGSLGPALESILGVLKEGFEDYQILIFDDCSSDRTGEIADNFAKKYSGVQVFHNAQNMGIGYAYRKGLELATKNYYTLIHGDDEISSDLMKKIFQSAGEADFTITYIETDTRVLARRIISKTFTALVNGFFGFKVPYYNGPSLVRTELLRNISLETNGHAFMAEIIVKLLKKGHHYKAIGFKTIIRPEGKSKAFRFKNIVSVLKALWTMKTSLSRK